MKIRSKTIHIGSEPNLQKGGSGDVVVPIHLSTTFAREKVDSPTGGYEYSRSGNPTRFALEKNLAALEEGTDAFAYASGLAAITNVLLLLKSGDHILSIDDVYGGTRVNAIALIWNDVCLRDARTSGGRAGKGL